MTSMVEGMTVTFLPEQPAIQLTKECSQGISKNVTCKGNMVCCQHDKKKFKILNIKKKHLTENFLELSNGCHGFRYLVTVVMEVSY